ncbi:MAG: hypothetical protein RBT50_00540 [Bacteroidales bacterium]|jgi:hypothetical protein|nr:hypothetical protein [Bacteroidales bacterium]
MEKETIGLNRDTISDQPVIKVSPRRLSLRDSGLIHLFDELDLEVRQSLIDYLDRMGLVKESGVLVIPSSRHYFYDADDLKGVRTVITLRQLNHIREIKDFLKQITGLLPSDSNFIGCFIDNRSQSGFTDKYGNLPKQQSERAEAYENGIESRIPFINRMYSFIDSRTNRYLTRRSVTSLLKENGLELVGMTEINGLTYFHTRKDKPAA